MTFEGMMRVKNEARWLEESLESILKVCEHVYLVDDNSEDETYEIAASFDRVSAYRSPFEGLNEPRDRQWLLNLARRSDAEWLISIDGDEVLEAGAAEKIHGAAKYGGADLLLFRVLYYWNDERTIRLDGNFRSFHVPRAFRNLSGDMHIFPGDGDAGLHCYSIPSRFFEAQQLITNVALWHYGYIDAELRKRKFDWYIRHDPHNAREDGYRHILQGDPGGPAADAILLRGGPLELVSVDEFLEAGQYSRREREA